MNKIFKVKRNSAGQSVVTSEIDKSHTAGKVTTIAAGIALALVSGGASAVDYVGVNSNVVEPNQDGAGATGKIAIAIGAGATATGDYAASIGKYSSAAGMGAVALGDTTTAAGDASFAAGVGNKAEGIASTALGNYNTASGINSFAVGDTNIASNRSSVALGSINKSEGAASVAIGNANTSTARGSVAIGDTNTASAHGAVALGASTTATGNFSFAAGAFSGAIGHYSVAMGRNAQAEAENTIAMGRNAQAKLIDSVALGSYAVTNTDKGVTGYLANGETDATWQSTLAAVSVGNTAAGYTRQITGLSAGTADTDAVNVAQLKASTNEIVDILGGNAAVATDGNVTMTNIGSTGKDNINDAIAAAMATTVVAQGTGTTVTKATSGTTDTYTVSVSDDTLASITKAQTDATKALADAKAADDKIAANKAAQDALIATKADKTYVDAQDAALSGRIDMLGNSMNNGFDAMRNHINTVEDKLQAGIAGSNASASLPQVRGNGKSMMAFGLGGFQDKGALAIGYSRSSDNGKTVFKAHLNADTEKQFGGGLGLGFEW